MKRKLSALILCILFFSITSCGEKTKDEKSLINEIAKICLENEFSGSVLISFQDSIWVDLAMGFTNQEETIANNRSTIYPIASITKLFIKQSILNLTTKSVLSMNDTLSQYLDKIMFANKITISQLVHHQSGLPDIHNRIDKFNNPYELNYPVITEDLFDAINSFGQLDFQPGTRIGYSNSNYLILAYLIEKVTGKPLGVYLNETIFIPFEMPNTGLYKEHSKMNGHAEGFLIRNGEREFTPDFNFLNFKGSGNAYSTTNDLYNYYQNSQKLLPSWINQQLVQHSGLYPGYRTYYQVIPEIGFAIIILSNNGDFNPELIVDKTISYFTDKLSTSKRNISTRGYSGIYLADHLGNKIKASIKTQDEQYYYNEYKLIQVSDSCFLIPNRALTKLTFMKTGDSHYTMFMNDNGMLILFDNINNYY